MTDGLAALFYDGRTSTARTARVRVRRDPIGPGWLELSTDSGIVTHPLQACSLDDPVGCKHRRVELPDGGVVEVTDWRAWDALLSEHGLQGGARALSRAESRWKVALLAVAVTGALLWAVATHGVPALVARALPLVPATLDDQIGREGLALLDNQWFEPSELPHARQQELRAAFDGVVRDVHESPDTRLEFRRGAQVGANAFALPGRIVVLTDELALLARHDDELRAVFAHELGHVRHRHAMRALLAGSMHALLSLAVLGDVSAATTLVASIPTTIAHSAYSRDLEREADAIARAWLAQAELPQSRYDDLLRRLDAQAGEAGRWSYLSSHPALEERLDGTATNGPRS